MAALALQSLGHVRAMAERDWLLRSGWDVLWRLPEDERRGDREQRETAHHGSIVTLEMEPC